MDKFTSEDIKALREYLDKLEAWNKEDPPERLTPEEWDEALTEIQKTGKIPAKYEGRIAENEVEVFDGLEPVLDENGKPILNGNGEPRYKHVVYNKPKKKKAYYDIADNERNKRLSALHKEYQKVFDKAIMFSIMEERKTGEAAPKEESGTGFIRRILENPVIMRELEKEARRMEKQELPALGSMPTGETLYWISRISASKNGRFPRQSNGNRHEEIITQKKGDSLRFTRKNTQNGNIVIVEIAQADKYLSKTNKTFTKMLLFTLQKMNAQNYPLEVGFSLQELVDLGMYSTTSNAGRAIKEFIAQQKQTMLSGSVKKKRKTVKEEGGILFYHYRLENGYVKLSVNENFNMEFIANYFTVFPRFAYALSNNAFNLVRYIFFLARQNTKPIKEKGTFTISLDNVRENLGLPAPDEVKNRKYRQYIIEPIEAAIEEIEVTAQKAPEAKEYGFTITPVGTDTSNINKWLEGYLEIGLKGDFAETFVKLATKAEQDREKWNRIKTAELAKLAARKEAEVQ